MQDFAAKIADARRELDELDEQLFNLHKREQRVSRELAGGNSKPYGYGRDTKGCKDHGKKAVPTTGGGDNSHYRRRLHRSGRNPRRRVA